MLEIAISKFKVEKHVKIPDRRNGLRCPFPFDDMGVGDSFLIGYQKELGTSGQMVEWQTHVNKVSHSFREWRGKDAKERGHLVLVTRNVGEGLRCWVQRNPWGSANVD